MKEHILTMLNGFINLLERPVMCLIGIADALIPIVTLGFRDSRWMLKYQTWSLDDRTPFAKARRLCHGNPYHRDMTNWDEKDTN